VQQNKPIFTFMNFSQCGKLAFIANIAFIVAIIMRFYPLIQGFVTESMILAVGLFISPIVNMLVTGISIFSYLKGSPQKVDFIQLFNSVMLILQVIVFLFFSGLLSLK
jgi:hypothetical protein